MSEIARSAGLRQSSVYYWFARKEHILQALLEENRTSLELARTLEPAIKTAASARLYAVLYTDTMQLCQAPLDFYEFERVARSQPQNFGSFFEDYANLHQLTASIIRQGVEGGELVEGDASGIATAALALNEGLQRHYRQPVPGLRKYSAAEVSAMSADSSLRSLLLSASVEEVRTTAAPLIESGGI